MRLASWNVNGLRSRLDLVLLWLRERRPDVAGLQEIKVTDEQFPARAFEDAGYRVAVHGQKGWNGVAILGRGDLEVVRRGLPGREGAGARLLTATVGALSFTTVYCPNGKDVGHPDFALKLAWMDALVEHLRAPDGGDREAVVCGDFNVCPTSLDTWDEERLRGTIFHTEQERERFRSLLAVGFRDVFRERFPGQRTFSWWDYRAGAFHRGQGLRIDFLLATPGLAARVRDAGIDREYRKKKEGRTPSDHAPVWVDLD